MLSTLSGLVTALGRLIPRSAPANSEGLDGQIVQVARSDGAYELRHKAEGKWWTPGGRETLVETVGELLTLDTQITVYVGSQSGDFATLGAALRHLSTYTPAAAVEYPLAVVVIRSGVTLAEQIRQVGNYLAWIEVRSEDAEVEVDVSDFVVPAGRTRCIFYESTSGATPVFRTIFKRVGTNATASAAPNGIIGLMLSSQSNSILQELPGYDGDGSDHAGTGFKAWGTNVYVSSGSSLTANLACLDDATQRGVIVANGAAVLTGAKMRRASLAGLFVLTSGSAIIGGNETYPAARTDARKTDGVNSTEDYVIDRDGEIILFNGNYDGGFSNQANTLSQEGMISSQTAPMFFDGFIKPQTYVNVAALPSAALYSGAAALVLSSSVGRALVVSDGTNWKVFATEGATATD